jgi:P27 family predicted phage terminase small subunit
MAKRGRKPVPPQLRILKQMGAGAKSFPLPARLVKRPDKPRFVESDANASDLWDKIVPDLVEAKVLSVLDGTALSLLCHTYSVWRDCVDDIAKNGPISEGASGAPKPNPAVTMGLQAAKQCQSLMAEFGLTPSSRAKINPAATQELDELDAFLGGAG